MIRKHDELFQGHSVKNPGSIINNCIVADTQVEYGQKPPLKKQGI